MTKPTRNFSVRVSPELHELLIAESVKQHLSTNALINDLLKLGLSDDVAKLRKENELLHLELAAHGKFMQLTKGPDGFLVSYGNITHQTKVP